MDDPIIFMVKIKEIFDIIDQISLRNSLDY